MPTSKEWVKLFNDQELAVLRDALVALIRDGDHTPTVADPLLVQVAEEIWQRDDLSSKRRDLSVAENQRGKRYGGDNNVHRGNAQGARDP